MRRHLKRLRVPGFWSVPKKANKWVSRPRPGPHRLFESIPLVVVVRDVLKLAEKASDAKSIIKAREVMVDGRPRTDHKFGVGLMDVVSIPKLKKSYRVLPTAKGLELVEIGAEDAGRKLYRIRGKRVVKGGRAQLNLHDGSCVLMAAAEAKAAVPGDTVVMDIASKRIEAVLRLEKGADVLITKGKNMGASGKVEEIISTGTKEPAKIQCIVGGDRMEVIKSYVFVVGKSGPAIKLAA